MITLNYTITCVNERAAAQAQDQIGLDAVMSIDGVVQVQAAWTVEREIRESEASRHASRPDREPRRDASGRLETELP